MYANSKDVKVSPRLLVFHWGIPNHSQIEQGDLPHKWLVFKIRFVGFSHLQQILSNHTQLQSETKKPQMKRSTPTQFTCDQDAEWTAVKHIIPAFIISNHNQGQFVETSQLLMRQKLYSSWRLQSLWSNFRTQCGLQLGIVNERPDTCS